MIATIIVGLICAGIFYLIGPMGIIIIGCLLAIGGIKACTDEDK